MTTVTKAPATTARGGVVDPVMVLGVSRVFQTKRNTVTALDDVSLTVRPGEFVSLIGPSGCGKSTLLRLIADLDRPTAGEVAVFGKTAHRARIDQDYGMAFQQAGLLPWKTVRENIALPLKLHKRPGIRERVDDLLDQVGLTEFADHHPDQLSGGMQQRVAICRAMAEKPNLLLMDEPFGALDEMTREKMQADLKRLTLETGAAVVFVTHSIPEAVFLSDRVVVMSPRPGRIREVIDIDLPDDEGQGLREEGAYFEAIKRVRDALHGSENTVVRGQDV